MRMTSGIISLFPILLIGLLTAEFFLARKSRRAGLIIPFVLSGALLVSSLLFGGILSIMYLPFVLLVFIAFGIGRFVAYLDRKKRLSELDKMNLDDL